MTIPLDDFLNYLRLQRRRRKTPSSQGPDWNFVTKVTYTPSDPNKLKDALLALWALLERYPILKPYLEDGLKAAFKEVAM